LLLIILAGVEPGKTNKIRSYVDANFHHRQLRSKEADLPTERTQGCAERKPTCKEITRVALIFSHLLLFWFLVSGKPHSWVTVPEFIR
jgi:hypothetical protein